jgi:predicted nucleic acid-binding protein
LVVVSDSGPIIASERIEQLELLPELFTVRPCLDALQRASFYLTPDLYRRVLADAGETPLRRPARRERI